MRLRLRHLSFVAAPLLLTACPSAYTGPVEVPQRATAVPVGAYVALGAYVRGSGAPMPASSVTAKCVDASICDVAVVGNEVRIGGKKAGEADVVVAYEEMDGTPTEQHVTVRFVEGLVEPIEVGKQEHAPEHLQTIDDVQLGGRKASFACTPDLLAPSQHALGESLDLGSPSRGNARLYTCLEKRALSSSDAYYRFGSWGSGYQEASTEEERVYVCAQARPESSDYLSLSMYRYIGGVPVLLERRGETSDVCGLKEDAHAGPRASAKVVSIADSAESAIYKKVTIELQAPAGAGCEVRGYELRWPGGKKSLDLDGVKIEAGKTDQRTLRVDLTDGDIESLGEARVIARAVCR